MQAQYKVYLAGPITGLSYGGAVDWREQARMELAHLSQGRIEAYSPMRGKDYLAGEADLSALGYDDRVLSTARGITTRDRFDCLRADAILVNFLGAEKASIGTAMEIAWADLRRVPVVAAMEAAANPHDHAMVNECIGFRVPTLNQAIATVAKILLP